ncbi:MAG: M14 family metallopeptidase [Vicinamibacteria bacterium]|nr:M14 family metallopeptidase [Vicinamibacteria bacterium]
MTRLILLSLLLAVPALAAEPLKVGALSAAPGQRVSGWLEIPAGVDEATRVPVSVVHGAQPGPVLALIAGTHGYEYPPILALQRLLPQLDAARMKGSVILVHMVAPAAFYGRRIYYSPDGKNQNRVYPGRLDGSQSERIAHAITTEVIERATHVVDVHGGDGNEDLRTYSYWQLSGQPAVDAASREMVLAWGFDHVVVDRERPKDKGASVYTSNTAVLRGKPAITVESGAMGRSDEELVAAHLRGARSLLAHLGILDGPSARIEQPIWFEPAEVVRAKHTGLWQAERAVRDVVTAGTPLGRVTDPFGNLLEEVRAPFAGVLLYVVGTPPVTAGEPLAFVATPLPGEPRP